ncbi:MAG TPA: hypothetical protein VMV71_01715 [Candidatus Paceibacterota bacterium]|nr:hypothetical protein [Candidatus Paceibacterota bacterium]
MQHFGFLFFVILVGILVFYAFFLYGTPQRFNIGLGGAYNATTTAPAAQTAPAKTYISSAPAAQTNTQIGQQTNYSQTGPAGAASQPSPTYYGRLNLSPSQIPPGFSIRDISPYFGQISLSAYPGSPGYYSQIVLTGNLAVSGGSLDVTGWLLRGNRGSQYVPQAVDVYDPSGMTPQSDIYMKNGDMLYIYSTNSAIGVNLRLNKCMGYLSNANNFIPPLNLNCPVIDRSEIINFTGQCQNYITSLNSCQMPAPNPPISIYDYSCKAYLDKLNYGGCFEKHRNDYDFLSNKWYAWSGSQFLDFQHDRLLLFDKNGLLVAEYDY